MARRRFINFRKETAEMVSVAYGRADEWSVSNPAHFGGNHARDRFQRFYSSCWLSIGATSCCAWIFNSASHAGYHRCLPCPPAIPGTNADIESWGGADLHINEARYRQPLPNHRPPVGDGAVNSVVVPGVRFQAHF